MNHLICLSIVVASFMFQAVMPMNASDFTLNVFGNANMDDTIDEKDIEYVEGIVNGKNDVTKLADANYDGKIGDEDIDQINSIISGTEKELIFEDCNGKNTTVHKPLNKIIAIQSSSIEALRILDAYDDVVGIDEWTLTNYPTLCSGLNAQSVGAHADLDAETIIKLNPDVVICRSRDQDIEKKLEGTGIDVVRHFLTNPETYLSELKTLSYILDREDEALAYCEWYEKTQDKLLEKTLKLSGDEKPNVLWYRFEGESGKKTTCGGDTIYNSILEIAGGKNAALNINDYPELDTEWALKQNPDVILGVSFAGGYETGNSSILRQRYEDIINTTGFEHISATKNKKIFIIYSALGGPCDKAYIAKWLHPDLFTDLDPVSIQQEYISKFLHLDFDIKAQGAFVYP